MFSEFNDPRLHEDNEPNDPRLDPDETERVLSDKLKDRKNQHVNIQPTQSSDMKYVE